MWVLSPAPSTFASGTCRVVGWQWAGASTALICAPWAGVAVTWRPYSTQRCGLACLVGSLISTPSQISGLCVFWSSLLEQAGHSTQFSKCQGLIGPSFVTDRKMDLFSGKSDSSKFGQHCAVVLVQSRISVVIRVNAKNWMLWHPFIYDSTTVLDRQLRQSSDDTATT